jgi:hypothetical protein
MTGPRFFSLRTPCGIWSVFFAAAVAQSPITENITMLKCFGICSKVAEFARALSRRPTTEQRQMPVSSLRPDKHSDRRQKRVIFDSDLLIASCSFGAPIHCVIEEPLGCRTRKGGHKPTATKTRQTNNADGAEFVHARRLLASLVFQQIRRHRSAAEAGEQSGWPYEPQLGRVPVSVPEIRSPLRRSPGLVASAQTASPALLPVPIEILFTELARRRLHSLAVKQRPS